MSSASSSSFSRAGKIALGVAGALTVATVAWAAVFDYRRRNDPAFRRKLAKQKQKLDKDVKVKQEIGKTQVEAALKRALALVNAEQVPATPEGKEQFFMEQVALGEQLAARSPEFYVASAISFYKALKVYPAPQELLMIYQKTQPQAVFDLVMELISLDINGAAESAASRREPENEPLLRELNDDVPQPQGQSQAPPPAPSDNGDDSSPSSGGSFVHVETDTVVDKEGDVAAQATETAVVDVPEQVVEQVKEEVEKVVEAEETQGEDPPEPTLAA
ncbi:TOM complex receptor protein TOM20 [Rhodotorula paludigena]|uniref:TOM complex receptor protein TOM20 n=1 Tax=Rhodotorula paludigena TaxID=86838 RepID=UPI00317559C5